MWGWVYAFIGASLSAILPLCRSWIVTRRGAYIHALREVTFTSTRLGCVPSRSKVQLQRLPGIRYGRTAPCFLDDYLGGPESTGWKSKANAVIIGLSGVSPETLWAGDGFVSSIIRFCRMSRPRCRPIPPVSPGCLACQLVGVHYPSPGGLRGLALAGWSVSPGCHASELTFALGRAETCPWLPRYVVSAFGLPRRASNLSVGA